MHRSLRAALMAAFFMVFVPAYAQQPLPAAAPPAATSPATPEARPEASSTGELLAAAETTAALARAEACLQRLPQARLNGINPAILVTMIHHLPEVPRPSPKIKISRALPRSPKIEKYGDPARPDQILQQGQVPSIFRVGNPAGNPMA
jgi:hypothetical protein